MTKVIKLQPVYRQKRGEPMARKVPKLTLQGNWLEDAGFHVDNMVQVRVENGKLTIIKSVL